MAETKKDIVRRAHDRFRAAQEWEADSRQRFKDDIRFLYADPDDQNQWNAAVRAQRQLAGQPMVTINKVHTHWLHVVNQGKENKPQTSAMEMAADMGIELLTEEQYRALQALGEFDLKTSSWIRTPAEVRSLGGALFCDRRYGRVFTYHNGAQSYYAARGFRGCVQV